MTGLFDTRADLAPTAVLDFETTGLYSQKGDRVVEVAVLRVERGRKPVELSTFVNPGMPIPADAVAVHGIHDEQVTGAPTWAEVGPEVLSVLAGAVIVAHNAPFDLGFLRRENAWVGAPLPALGPVVCTLAMARNIFGLPRCNLGALARRTGVPHLVAHRAMSDARATLGVYRAMVQAVSQDGVPTPADILRLVDDLAKGGPGRRRISAAVRAAAVSGQPILIDYTTREGANTREVSPLCTRRIITVTRVRAPYIDAFCHLRNQERVFRLDRIFAVVG